jgi:hypothetical protein
MSVLSAKMMLTFGATDYYCLQQFTWNGQVQISTAECSSATGAETKKEAGAINDNLTFDMLIPKATYSTVVNALKRGTEATDMAFYPIEDNTGEPEMTATKAIVANSTASGGTSTHNVLSLTLELEGWALEDKV